MTLTAATRLRFGVPRLAVPMGLRAGGNAGRSSGGGSSWLENPTSARRGQRTRFVTVCCQDRPTDRRAPDASRALPSLLQCAGCQPGDDPAL